MTLRIRVMLVLIWVDALDDSSETLLSLRLMAQVPEYRTSACDVKERRNDAEELKKCT